MRIRLETFRFINKLLREMHENHGLQPHSDELGDEDAREIEKVGGRG